MGLDAFVFGTGSAEHCSPFQFSISISISILSVYKAVVDSSARGGNEDNYDDGRSGNMTWRPGCLR